MAFVIWLSRPALTCYIVSIPSQSLPLFITAKVFIPFVRQVQALFRQKISTLRVVFKPPVLSENLSLVSPECIKKLCKKGKQLK
jgi:hypothetical protein|nr:MAG TPA: hypothetical protein [Caudoviricetes sp.]